MEKEDESKEIKITKTTMKKPPPTRWLVSLPGNDLLSQGWTPSTIGAGGLNFRVRDGNGWIPSAIITRRCFLLSGSLKGTHPENKIGIRVASGREVVG
jgi:hypothetical protein